MRFRRGGGAVIERPRALLTCAAGVELVEVVEVDGVLVRCDDGRPVELVSLVEVFGLAPLDGAA